jgi:formamidopyrimidine-DNA glycosylase
LIGIIKMPELPDVETIKRTLEAQVLGKQIQKVIVKDVRSIEGVNEKNLNNTLKGNKIKALRRHGKYLFIELDHGIWLTLHFGMTGNFALVNGTEKEVKFERVSFLLSETERLAFEDQRIFGRIKLISSPEEFIRNNKLGPDALSVSWEEFFTIFRKKNTAIKEVLMDQSKISGIGNVYADEILFQAQISPFSISSQLSEKAFHLLYEKTGIVLRTAIEFCADRNALPEGFILKHRGKKSLCPRCGHELSTEKITGRTTYLCSYCQKE